MTWEDIWGFRDETKKKYIINPKGKKLRGWRKRMAEYNDKCKQMVIDTMEKKVNGKTVDKLITQERGLPPRQMVSSKTLFTYNKAGNRVPIRVFAKDRVIIRKEGSRVVSKAVQREVWRRDQGRCVDCGSTERLEYDHIIPFSKGGSNTVRNIQLLCEKCNRSKYNKI